MPAQQAPSSSGLPLIEQSDGATVLPITQPDAVNNEAAINNDEVEFISEPCANPKDAPALHSEIGISDELAHSNNFPPFDFSFAWSHIFWLIISFGCFYYFISRIIAPRIGDLIETREGRIASDFDHAMRLKKEADEVVSLYEKELHEARAKAQMLAAQTAEQAKAKLEAARKNYEAQLAARLSESDAKIKQEMQDFMANFDELVIASSQAMVKKLINRDIAASKIKAELS